MRLTKEREQELRKRASLDCKDLLSEIDALKDENKSLIFSLEQKSREIGRAEHRGNTVDYIYDKLENYSHQLSEVGSENRKLRERIEKLRESLKIIAASWPMNHECAAQERAGKALTQDNESEKKE